MYKIIPYIIVLLLLAPQPAVAQTLLTFADGLLDLINRYVIPLLLALAMLIFIINIVRYFMIRSADEKERINARYLALYGIIAFVFIATIWGIINFVVAGFGFPDAGPVGPDYPPRP